MVFPCYKMDLSESEKEQVKNLWKTYPQLFS
jgi:hypothetical protein